jgi:hypothetical protein
MNNHSTGNENELRRIVRMLEKTTSLAENASLTGSMSGGREFAIRSYNSVLQHLSSTGEIPAALFPPLPETASLDEVGIASAQLAEYLRAGLPEAEKQAGEGEGMKLGDGNVFFNIGSLGEIADMVRENLPDWLRGKREQKEPQSERQEAAQSEPTQAPNPPSGGPAATSRAPLPPQRARIEELRPERQGEETPR